MRSAVKRILHLVFLLLVLPLALLFFVLRVVTNPDTLVTAFSQFLSLFPGKLGSYFRTAFYRLVFTNCSQDAVIGFGTLFSHKDTSINSGAYIGPQSNIGMCEIGENCLLGSGVHVLSGKNQHNFNDPNTPIKDQGGHYEKITIGNNTWVGNCAIIMANVGANCVIAAGAVVVNEVPENSIVAGNPGKVIRKTTD
ncbi:acyltransferase [Glaciecola sp. 1036]|uniref:acyltransferase n=1 Tax=Alteromonadaceae TaxID=72275 RepID=UPI003D048BF4